MATLRRALRVLRELGRDPRTNGRALLDVGANIGTTTISALVLPAAVELWPAALRSSRTLRVLRDAVCRYCTRLVDLGAPEAERSPRLVSALDALASAQGDGFTDLLLLGSDERAG
jgi:hypothetical protein